MNHDPKRLIVSESNDLGLGLASARRQLPNANDVARLARRLAEAGIALPEHAVHLDARPAANPAPLAPRFGLGAKLGLGLGALAAVSGLGAWLASREPRHDASTSTFPSATLPSPADVAVAPRTALVPPRATQAAPDETAVATPSPALARRTSAEPVATAPASIGVAPRTAPVTARPLASIRRAPSESPIVAAPSANSIYVAPTARETPVTEIELVKQARNAVNSDPARAYALTERCRADFPRAAFGQERDYIAITALARLGRESQARALASSFRARYPRSVYISQLARLLGTE